MMNNILSPSILGYERNLEGNLDAIRGILRHADWLHIDVMRRPFTEDDRFYNDALHSAIYEFGDGFLDIHIMAAEPEEVVDDVNECIPKRDRKRVNITIHREAYRKESEFGKYSSKEYDLYCIETGNPAVNRALAGENRKLGEDVRKTLKAIKGLGYGAGLALEPGTGLDNVTEGMLEYTDMLLLMAVSSGKGGQAFKRYIPWKIRKARDMYGKELMIQVDGGIKYSVNEERNTLGRVLEAGVHNAVVGSDITGTGNPAERARKIKAYMNAYSESFTPSIQRAGL